MRNLIPIKCMSCGLPLLPGRHVTLIIREANTIPLITIDRRLISHYLEFLTVECPQYLGRIRKIRRSLGWYSSLGGRLSDSCCELDPLMGQYACK